MNLVAANAERTLCGRLLAFARPQDPVLQAGGQRDDAQVLDVGLQEGLAHEPHQVLVVPRGVVAEDAPGEGLHSCLQAHVQQIPGRPLRGIHYRVHGALDLRRGRRVHDLHLHAAHGHELLALLEGAHAHGLLPGDLCGDLLGLLRAQELHVHRQHAAQCLQLPRDPRVARDGHDGHRRSEPRQAQGRLLCGSEEEDCARIALDGSLHRSCGHQVVLAAQMRLLREAPEEAAVVDGCLGLLAHAAHGADGLHGERAAGCLGGEHHAIRAIENSVGNVRSLCARRPRSAGHGLQHLRGCDHWLPGGVALTDDQLLRQDHLLHWNLHAQVAAPNHDPVTLLQDLVDAPQARHVFDLRDDADGLALLPQDLAHEAHVRGALHKARGHEVHALRHGEVQEVVPVLQLEHRQVQVHARQVDVLPLAEREVVQHPGHNVRQPTREDLQRQAAVGDVDVHADGHCRGEPPVGHGDAGRVTPEARVRH
mmetsp:Transcript_10821/g.33818  ORF Transcript_10821/g.33818 Transcript_10821/m.33818 type:complete len:480 (+) Transcript_10821:563-2002(+)